MSDGNSKIILDTLRSLHEDNKNNIRDLERKIDGIQSRVSMLPCSAHIEKFKRYDEHLDHGMRFRLALIPIIVSLLGTMVAGIVTFSNVSHALSSHIEWGKEHLKLLEQEIEHKCRT